MLITVSELVNAWSIQPTGVIHVGAHTAEETKDYQRYNWKPVTWVEANPKLIDRIRESVPKEDVVICAALWNEDGISIDFNLATNGASSSLKKPALHLKEYPAIRFDSYITLKTKRLDSILTKVPNFLNLDVQGSELEVLQGMGKLLDSLDYIFAEVNDIEMYIKCTKLEDLDAYLKSHGFHRICLRRFGRAGWGDALYARKALNLRRSSKITARTLITFFKFRALPAIRSIQKLLRF